MKLFYDPRLKTYTQALLRPPTRQIVDTIEMTRNAMGRFPSHNDSRFMQRLNEPFFLVASQIAMYLFVSTRTLSMQAIPHSHTRLWTTPHALRDACWRALLPSELSFSKQKPASSSTRSAEIPAGSFFTRSCCSQALFAIAAGHSLYRRVLPLNPL